MQLLSYVFSSTLYFPNGEEKHKTDTSSCVDSPKYAKTYKRIYSISAACIQDFLALKGQIHCVV